MPAVEEEDHKDTEEDAAGSRKNSREEEEGAQGVAAVRTKHGQQKQPVAAIDENWRHFGG